MTGLLLLVAAALSGAGLLRWIARRRSQADARERQGVVSYADGETLTPQQTQDARLVSLLEEDLRDRFTHTAALTLTAENGVVTLSGPVLATEHAPLVAYVRSFRGVRGVHDQLRPQRQRGDLPDVHSGSDIDDSGV